MSINADMKMPELRAAAKEEYGLTFPVGVSKIDIIAACEKKEAEAVTPAPVYEKPELTQKDEPLKAEPKAEPKPEPPKAQQPAAPDQNAFMEKLAKEAIDRLMGGQQIQPKKEGKPDAEIEKAHKTDKAKIRGLEKVWITMPWYPGAPKKYTSVVNGDMCVVITGKPKLVSIAHYENFMRSNEGKQKNANKLAKKEKEFLKA